MEPRSLPNTAGSVSDGNEDSRRDDDNGDDSENHNACDSKIDAKEMGYKLIDYEGEDQFVNSNSWNMRIKNPEKYSELDEDDYYGDDGDVQDHAEKGVVFEEEEEEETNESDNVELNDNNPKRSEKSVMMWEVWEEETNKWLDENMEKDNDLENNQDEVVIGYREKPSNMIVELLRYQMEWLAWAFRQESSLSRGGILADEMGMGKTVQAIALVLAKRQLYEEIGETYGAMLLSGPSTALTRVKGTLVICPTSVVTQWESEIDKCTSKGSTKVLVYYGAKREKDFEKLSEYDFVITTYGIVNTEFRKSTSPDPKDTTEDSNRTSFFHAVQWERIILDEAHFIRNKNSSTTKAIYALESIYKWALSGTPFQNNVEEIFSLIRFLQIIPYSFYFCRACDCRILDFEQNKCLNCPHNSYQHFSWWNKYIGNPLRNSGPQGQRRPKVLLKNKILKSILLRRTKEDRHIELSLPQKIVSLRKDSLSIEEQDFYKSLYEETAAKYNAYVQEGTRMDNFVHIFDLLTRLRQAVDHPYLVKYSSYAKENSESCVSENPPENPEKKNIKGVKSSSFLNRIQLDEFETSTKIEALREEIRLMFGRDGSAKGIVFSYFTSFLDLINYFLQRSGVQCVRMYGGMNREDRDSAIKKFNEDPDSRILLLNLISGSVAVNLNAASHVFLMEPWWNPALEHQAQDRVHRIGQNKPVRVVRFIIENTIEEIILKRQDDKELVFKGTMGEDFNSRAKFAKDLEIYFRHRWP